MRWLHTEYLLKGIFLGLLAFAALQHPTWDQTGLLAAFLGGGLLIALVVALVNWLPRGIRVGGRLVALLLFLLLESPTLVYFGLVGGLLAGALWIKDPEMSNSVLPICVGVGALVGIAISEARRIGSSNWRSSAAAAVACILVGAAIYYIEEHPVYHMENASPLRTQIGLHLLLGLPFFYLLTFAGRAEETEAEFAALCAALAVGVWLVNPFPALPSVALIIPAGLYVVYTRQVLPGLRVFKHTLRGYSYTRMGQIRPALKSFRRALSLDPRNQLAVTGLTRLHSGIDLRQLAGDTETIALLDLDLCLNRAGRLLWQPAPTPEALDEVNHLLELVATQQPRRLPEAEYWRTVADMRTHKIDSAVARLARLLDPAAWSPEESFSRDNILFVAWQMVLLRSNDLAGRVGKPQLGLPGRRMEAIAATEKRLALDPKDADGWELKRYLYDGLTESEFDSRPPIDGEFDGGYARELGLALLGDAARWRRGVEYLKMAAKAMPQHGPSIYMILAQTFERAGEAHHARACYAFIREAGMGYGPANLPEEDKTVFYGVVKRLADEAANRDEPREAIGLLQIIVEGDRAGIETYRQLAAMHERLGDALAALHFNDMAMVYNSSDPDLLARKDRYYFSVTPEQLRQAPENVRTRLDLDYCIKKARGILGGKQNDVDSIEWASHLAELASVIKPELLEPKVLLARALLWRGERDRALQILEDIRENKPAKFANSNDEEAWYRCHQLLGDLYLNDFARADLAVPCYNEFRQSPKSGADTLFKLGQAYEALGDPPRALRFYEQVTGYTEHPRYYDAQEAVRRLKQ